MIDVLRDAFPNSGVRIASSTVGLAALGHQADYALDGETPMLEETLQTLTEVVTICDDCDACHALDLYRTPVDTAASPEDWPYTEMGKLVYEAKYLSDPSAADRCTKRLEDTICHHAGLQSADAVCSVPASSSHGGRPDLPPYWANNLAISLGLQHLDLHRTRTVKSQKESKPEERKANQEKSMACDADLDGRSIIVIDDLYMQGDTMSEASRALREAGAQRVLGLCAAKTAKGTRGLGELLE